MKTTFRGFSEEEVEHLAWLARIELSQEEKKLFALQLSTILEYFNVIDEVNTEGVPPTLQVLDLVNVSRGDIVEKSLTSVEALKNAPMKDKGYFKAPRIL